MAALLIPLTFTACGDDDDDLEGSEGSEETVDEDDDVASLLMGTWLETASNVLEPEDYIDEYHYLQFLEDHTYREIYVWIEEDEDIIFVGESQWSLDGYVVTVSESEDFIELSAYITNLTETELETYTLGISQTYVRVDASEAEQYLTSDSKTRGIGETGSRKPILNTSADPEGK